MKHIAISIEYAGLTLPVVKNDRGVECVPLKPLCDLFGLKWETQRTKVSERFYADYLGVCVQKAWVATPLKGGSSGEFQEQTCIRLDRVAAFMMTINPDRVRANGNEEGAAFLQAKLIEWADALLAMRWANTIATVAKIKDAALRKLALAEIGIDLAMPAAAPKPGTGDLFPRD